MKDSPRKYPAEFGIQSNMGLKAEAPRGYILVAVDPVTSAIDPLWVSVESMVNSRGLRAKTHDTPNPLGYVGSIDDFVAYGADQGGVVNGKIIQKGDIYPSPSGIVWTGT